MTPYSVADISFLRKINFFQAEWRHNSMDSEHCTENVVSGEIAGLRGGSDYMCRFVCVSSCDAEWWDGW
jgi:hypothetical protein